MSLDRTQFPADHRFEIRPSTIPAAGNGLFAAVNLAEGEMLEVLGHRVLAESLEDRCTSFADSHKFRVGDFLLIPFGPAGMANHSTTANLVKEIHGERVFLRTNRAVAYGEELFLTYVARALIYFQVDQTAT